MLTSPVQPQPMSVVVFASGRGSNAHAIFKTALENPALLTVVAVICNNLTAGVVNISASYGIPCHVVPIRRQSTLESTRLEHEARIHAVLELYSWSYICLAGYMRILTSDFVNRYPHPTHPVSRILNIHPSLLPAFKGHNGYEDAFQYGVEVSGVTIHFVSAEVDSGVILAQRSFVRLFDDGLAEFCARGLAIEHSLYSEVLLALASRSNNLDESPFGMRILQSSCQLSTAIADK